LIVFREIRSALKNVPFSYDLLFEKFRFLYPIRSKVLILLLFLLFLTFALPFSAGFGLGERLISQAVFLSLKGTLPLIEENYFQILEREGSEKGMRGEEYLQDWFREFSVPVQFRCEEGYRKWEWEPPSYPGSLKFLREAIGGADPPGGWTYFSFRGKKCEAHFLFPRTLLHGWQNDYTFLFLNALSLGGILFALLAILISRTIGFSLRNLTLWALHLSRGATRDPPKIFDDDDFGKLGILLNSVRRSIDEQVVAMEKEVEELRKDLNILSSLLQKEITEGEGFRKIGVEILERITFLIHRLREEEVRGTELIHLFGDLKGDIGRIFTCQKEFLEKEKEFEEKLMDLKKMLQEERVKREEEDLRMKKERENFFATYEKIHQLRKEIFSRMEREFSLVKEWEEGMDSLRGQVRNFLEKVELLKEVSAEETQYSNLISRIEDLSQRFLTLAEETYLSSLNASIRSSKVEKSRKAFDEISAGIQELARVLEEKLKEGFSFLEPEGRKKIVPEEKENPFLFIRKLREDIAELYRVLSKTQEGNMGRVAFRRNLEEGELSFPESEPPPFPLGEFLERVVSLAESYTTLHKKYAQKGEESDWIKEDLFLLPLEEVEGFLKRSVDELKQWRVFLEEFLGKVEEGKERWEKEFQDLLSFQKVVAHLAERARDFQDLFLRFRLGGGE